MEELVSQEEHEHLVGLCDAYLLAMHVTLWGESFEVISPAGRAQASEWLARQIEGVAASAQGQDPLEA